MFRIAFTTIVFLLAASLFSTAAIAAASGMASRQTTLDIP